jgi:molybdate/tungstate transport system permease protein
MTKDLSMISSRRIKWFDAALTLLGSCVVLFVVAPLISIVLATSIADLTEVAVDQQVIRSIKLTMIAAFFATSVSAIAGIPLAYVLARKNFFGRSVLLAVIDLPIIIPHSAAGIALLTLIGRRSLMGRFLDTSLTGTAVGISVAMAFVSVPFLVNAAREAFLAVPEKQEKAARTLGASPGHVFFTISLPLAWRGIVSGMILMIVIIAYHPMTTPVMIFQRFNDFGLTQARSIAVLLILICVCLFIILRMLNNPKNQGPTNA